MEHRGDFGIPRIDLTGKRYGRIVVVRLHGRDHKGRYVWIVRCDCGTEKTVDRNTLSQYIDFDTCRCSQPAESRLGAHQTAEYANWHSMLNRCFNTKTHNYARYGGKGVTVCGRWSGSFASFLRDMGNRPSSAHTIDRINNDGSYTCGKHDLCDDCREKKAPANCRWATKMEQSHNLSSNVNITAFGETHCIAEWARKFDMTHASLTSRLRRGMDLEKAVNYKPSPRRRLTTDIVLEIRRRSEGGDSIASISNSLCISYGNVKAVVTRRTWRHV